MLFILVMLFVDLGFALNHLLKHEYHLLGIQLLFAAIMSFLLYLRLNDEVNNVD